MSANSKTPKSLKSTKTYKQICRDERILISTYLKLGYSHNKIATELNREQSTVSREIRRGSVFDVNTNKYEYNLDYSHKKKLKTRIETNKQQIKLEFESQKCPNLEKYIHDKIALKWSPQQISGRIKSGLEKQINNLEASISTETIYQYIYGLAPKELEKSEDEVDQQTYLRQLKLKVKLSSNLRENKGQFNKYRRRHGTRKRALERDKLNKKRIDTRQEIVETRTRIGDWEGDTIVGKEKTQHILTLVERRSRYLQSRKLNQATATETKEKIIDIFSTIPNHKKHTQTYDNGVQFSCYEAIEEITKVSFYFAFSYHSWERGTNENTNGLLRQYYPKGTLFSNITQQDLDQVVKEINNRPRKTLGYLTPYEVFELGMEF